MRTILLIEDIKSMRNAIERILTKAGYRVVVAGDGEEALHTVQQSIPDVILLDLMLPKLAGQEVLKALKRNPATVHIPVIVLTSLSQKNEYRLRSDGAAGFLEKGDLLNNPGPLLNTLRDVMDDHFRRQHSGAAFKV
jgi:CheY-like chemotaxis protein